MQTLTQKQQDFCQRFIETGCASKAYRSAYDAQNMQASTINEEASRLLGNPKIAARISEMQTAHRERHDLSVDMLTRMLLQDRELAREKGQAGASVRAASELAKLHGLYPEKGTGQGDIVVTLTGDEAGL